MKHIFLLGYPIALSLSPALHNAALNSVGLTEWRYELLEKQDGELPAVLARLRQDDCVGANVTIPYKETILRLLDDVSENARSMGAVNTIVKRDGKLTGENTDVAGFRQALREASFDPHGAHAVLLGAGGAARAVAFGLGQAGARRITILNRTQARAEAIVSMLRRHFPHLATATDPGDTAVDLVVNALAAHAPLATAPLSLARGALAFDLAYHNAETPFLRDAAASGARVMDGLGMLIYQGATAFTLWTGHQAPLTVMFDAARQVQAQRATERSIDATISDRR